MPTTVTVDELAGMSDTPLGTSDWLEMYQRRIDVFADATEDHQWIHVDPDRAAEGPFGATIAHGYLTLSLVPYLLDQVLVVSDQVRGTNYGVDRARFLSPLPVGSRVRLDAHLVQAARRADGGLQYSVKVTLEVEGSERPAMVAEVIYLAYAS